jgi:glycosyltransferase involved in cell wall biosynthesis
VTHGVCDTLHKTWDVHVIGLNYRGFPHQYPYAMYPAWAGGDGFGNKLIRELLPKIGPDVAFILNDPWNIPTYMKFIGDVPVMASLAVDGKNCRGRGLNGLKLAVFWTAFGMQEAFKGGYKGAAAVIPLGVDTAIFKPMDQATARHQYGLRGRAAEAFIVGNVNRNQPRKRLDLQIQYFAEWIKSRSVEDAYLMLHVAPTGDAGFDCEQLASYYGVANRLIIVTPETHSSVPEEGMALTYNCFDVLMNTSQNEGWHLPTLEAMASRVPTIVSDWAATSEWPEDAALKVPCTTTAVTPNNINVIGGVPDRDGCIAALDKMYRDKAYRQEIAERGYQLSQRPEFRWENIGEAYAEAIDEALSETTIPLKRATAVM